MPKRKRGEALNRREQTFVEEYIVDFNATAAAKRAGYSSRAAGQIGHENLKRPEIQAAIELEQSARGERLRYDLDTLLVRLCQELEADIADLFEADGTLKPVAEWPAIFRKGLVSSEPLRVCRRLQLLRRWSHHEQDDEQVFPGSAPASRAAGGGSRT